MFELYFGAFDILLYAAAFEIAVIVSGYLCEAEQSQPQLAYATATAIQPMAKSVVAVPQSRSVRRFSSEPKTAEPEYKPGRQTAVDSKRTSATTPVESVLDKPVIRLANLATYRLHKKDVVRVSDLPFTIPDTVKRYTLHGKPVVRLEALEKVSAIVTR